MNSYIKGVAVFKDDNIDGRRILKLSRGLNIITGHSKTGKSAILDIIDWCLGAKDSTIPQGVITNFANLYVLLIDLKGSCILLARENGAKGKNYLHIKQVPKNLTIEDVKLSHINRNDFLKLNIALERINEIINMSLNEQKLLDIDFKIPNVTLRSALSFNFQHQDIISSNSRLFYLAPVKNHFPILAGWFNSDYYIVLESIEKYNKAINRISKENESAKRENSKLDYNVRNSLRTYYNLIGVEFNENWSIDKCLTRIKTLEGFKKEEYSNKLIKRQEELEIKIEKNNSELIQINRQLSKLNTQKGKGSEFKELIERYKERAILLPVQPEYFCPICDKPNEKLSLEALSIKEADSNLKNELQNIPSYTIKFDKEIEAFDIQKNNLEKEISTFKSEYLQNQKLLEKITHEKNLNEIKQKAKWKVKSDADIYQDRHITVREKLLDEHKARLTNLLEIKRTYNENERYELAKREIEMKMSTIVELLDFEHKPPELYFELNPQRPDSYKLYHNIMGEERIFLRQIGSASNALACHIGLFLSFLSFFSNQDNSKVPSILFFDQPSQVYFPSGTDNDDIEKVGQIYETILDEIEKIEGDTGFTPQIIVADHIKDLGDKTIKLYSHYFKADWRDGKGFI